MLLSSRASSRERKIALDCRVCCLTFEGTRCRAVWNKAFLRKINELDLKAMPIALRTARPGQMEEAQRNRRMLDDLVASLEKGDNEDDGRSESSVPFSTD